MISKSKLREHDPERRTAEYSTTMRRKSNWPLTT